MPGISRTVKNTISTDIHIGFVKEVIDKKHAGRLKVWIPEYAGDELDEKTWILCNYCSPYAGTSSRKGNTKEIENFEGTQISYGFWAVPPDIDNEVVVLFPDGNPARALWIGGIFKEYAHHMVPGVAYSEKTFQTNDAVPAAEYNKFDNSVTTPRDPYRRPYSKTRTEGIGEQGLIEDKIRGLTTSSSMRDEISSVVGIQTPGPINPDGNGYSRQGGHSFAMDDGEDSEHIEFVTKSGAKIKLDETNELIYIINKKGTAWVQLDADGNVDIFSAKSISMRSQEDINLRADKNVNIEAGQNISIKAAKDSNSDGKIVGEGSGDGGDIFIQSLNDYHTTVESNAFFTVNTGNFNSEIKSGNQISFTGGKLEISSDGTLGLESSSAFTVKSSNFQIEKGGSTQANGDIIAKAEMYASDFKTPKLGLNSHIHFLKVFVTPKAHSPDVAPGMVGGGFSSARGPTVSKPDSAVVTPTNSKTNVLESFPSGSGDFELDYWNRDTEQIETILSRYPTYEPCDDHINKGE